MPVICCGHIVPRLPKALNPQTDNPRPNRDATITNPTRVLIIPINRPSHLSQLVRNPRLTPRSRGDRRRKIPLKIQTIKIQTAPSLPGINPITRLNHPIKHLLIMPPMGMPPIQLRPTLSPQQRINRLQRLKPILSGHQPLRLNRLQLRHLITRLNLLPHLQILPGSLPTQT